MMLGMPNEGCAVTVFDEFPFDSVTRNEPWFSVRVVYLEYASAKGLGGV